MRTDHPGSVWGSEGAEEHQGVDGGRLPAPSPGKTAGAPP